MARRISFRRGGAWAAAILAGSLFMASCSASSGGSGSGGSGSSSSSTLTIAFGNNTPFVDDFNPFSPTSNLQSQGLIYEPLWFFDMADASQSHPWLATSYAWSNGGKTLTVNLRHNVKWSDGKPFTSADVAFTFNLIKKNTSLNQNALPLAGATTEGPYTAKINFTQPSYTDINYIAGTTYIVPQHLWQNVSDPSTYQNGKPVGTGAYVESSVSGQSMTFTANPHYYQPGLPKIKTLRYLYFSGNNSIDLAIENGQVGLGWGIHPEHQADV